MLLLNLIKKEKKYMIEPGRFDAFRKALESELQLLADFHGLKEVVWENSNP